MMDSLSFSLWERVFSDLESKDKERKEQGVDK